MSGERVCFELQLKTGMIPEYTRRHAAVWPELLRDLKAAGWRNYSLFLRPDGLLIGYFETDSFEAAKERIAATEANARWQAEMSEFFEGPPGSLERNFVRLREVFNLDEQLSRAAADRIRTSSEGD